MQTLTALLMIAGFAIGLGLMWIALFLLRKRVRCSRKCECRPGPERSAPYAERERKHSAPLHAEGPKSDMHTGTEPDGTPVSGVCLINAREEYMPGTAAAEAQYAPWEEGDIVTDEEIARRVEEAEKERLEFIAAKRECRPCTVPALRFTLSREDVLDYAEDKAAAMRTEGHAILPNTLLRKKDHYCDSLHCGEWCFALMYERSGVIKFTLRLDDGTAERILEEHTAFRKALFPKGENWYDLVIDSSFGSKDQAYRILDDSFDYVFRRYYHMDDGMYVTDADEARADAESIGSSVADNADAHTDEMYDTAVSEYSAALEKHQRKHAGFRITREMILHHAESVGSGDDEAIARDKAHLPASLNAGGRTYALIYERMHRNEDGADEAHVTMTVRITDDHARWLALRHPGICRARFPNNRNWYLIPVDGSFRSADEVYRILKHAKDFVLGRRH